MRESDYPGDLYNRIMSRQENIISKSIDIILTREALTKKPGGHGADIA